jgi:hypothetical protein
VIFILRFFYPDNERFSPPLTKVFTTKTDSNTTFSYLPDLQKEQENLR